MRGWHNVLECEPEDSQCKTEPVQCIIFPPYPLCSFPSVAEKEALSAAPLQLGKEKPLKI